MDGGTPGNGPGPRNLVLDNPFLLREGRRWRREWASIVFLVLPAWVLLVGLLRVRRAFLPPVGAMTLWQAVLVDTLHLALRPDILLAFYFSYKASRFAQHPAGRDAIATTLATPGQVLVGVAVPPLLLLLALHFLGAPLYYREILAYVRLDIGMGLFSMQGAGALVIALLATVEDLLYAAVMVLVAFRQYMVEGDGVVATFKALAWAVGYGLAITACAFMGMPLGELIVDLLHPGGYMALLRQPGGVYIADNVGFFLVILPFEAAACWYLARSARRRVGAWLRGGFVR